LVCSQLRRGFSAELGIATQRLNRKAVQTCRFLTAPRIAACEAMLQFLRYARA
jgi:tRNA(Met) C34 N-acetyltransferase TmcA